MTDSMIDSMTNPMTDLMADSMTNIMNKSMTDRGVNLMTHAIMDPIADSMNDPMKNITMISSHIFLHYCSRLLMLNVEEQAIIFLFQDDKVPEESITDKNLRHRWFLPLDPSLPDR